MLDFKKLRKECIETIRSYSADDLQAWIDMDRERMALEDAKWEKMTKEERMSQLFESNCGIAWEIAKQNGSLNGAPKNPRKTIGKLNGVTQSTAKSKGVAIKKKKTTTPSKTRSRNSAKARATAV